MKQCKFYAKWFLGIVALLLVTSCNSFNQNEPSENNAQTSNEENQNESSQNQEKEVTLTMEVVINNQVFTAQLSDTTAAQQLVDRMPFTVQMEDLHSNEKYFRLTESLSTDQAEQPTTIHAGEIMSWNANTLVLFYETFSNSYGGYVKIAQIEDIEAFSTLLRNEDSVEVTFQNSH